MQDRPNLTLAVKRLVRDVAKRLPELGHVRASRILVVAGEARRTSRATIRPAHFRMSRRRAAGGSVKPLVKIKGRKILYVITLRPLWFVASTAEQRVATILHELYHASNRFDGTLHGGRRHGRLPLRKYNRRIQTLLRKYLAIAPPEILAPFAHHGEARVRMWLEGPGSFQDAEYAGRRIYTEQQLFYGLALMRTPHAGKPRKNTRKRPPTPRAGPSRSPDPGLLV